MKKFLLLVVLVVPATFYAGNPPSNIDDDQQLVRQLQDLEFKWMKKIQHEITLARDAHERLNEVMKQQKEAAKKAFELDSKAYACKLSDDKESKRLYNEAASQDAKYNELSKEFESLKETKRIHKNKAEELQQQFANITIKASKSQLAVIQSLYK